MFEIFSLSNFRSVKLFRNSMPETFRASLAVLIWRWKFGRRKFGRWNLRGDLTRGLFVDFLVIGGGQNLPRYSCGRVDHKASPFRLHFWHYLFPLQRDRFLGFPGYLFGCRSGVLRPFFI